MNVVFPTIKELAAGVGIGWDTGKFKMYFVDMDNAGPAAGAWKISAAAPGGSGMEITTVGPHGVSVGDQVAIFGITWVPTTLVGGATIAYSVDTHRRPSPPNGFVYRVVKGVATSTTPSSWPTSEGAYATFGSSVSDAGILQNVGEESNDPLNGEWEVATVPTSTTFILDSYPYDDGVSKTLTNAFMANLSKTYLSEFAGSGARVASDALTGKTILPGGILDCADFTLDGGSVSREALVLVKTAALHADADLADTAQRLVAYYDTMSGLPVAANTGVVSFAVSNTPDRLLKL